MDRRIIDVAKVLLEDSDGNFLVLKKAGSYGEFGGRWELPGGKVKDQEDRVGTLVRELFEETGLEVEDLEDLVRVEVEAEDCVNCFIMHSDTFTGEVKLSDEHSEFRWVKQEEFRGMDWHRDAGYGLPPMVFLEKYLEKENVY